MKVTIKRDVLGKEIILPNGESDGYEVLGTKDEEIEIPDEEYLAMYQDFVDDYTVTIDDIKNGDYLEDEFLKHLEEVM